LSQGRGFEVEAEVKKKPNDWPSGTGCNGRGMGMHPTLPLPLLFLPACQQLSSKTTKTKQIH